MSNIMFNKEEGNLLASLCTGLEEKVRTLYSKYENAEKGISMLRDVLLEKYRSVGVESDNKNAYVFAEFFAKASILAYFQLFDNDVDLNKVKLKHRKKNSEPVTLFGETVELEEEHVEYDVPTDFKFGFSGIDMMIQSMVECIVVSNEELEKVSNSIKSNLLTNYRDIELEAYIEERKYIADMYLIALLGEKQEVDLCEEILNIIREDTGYNSLVEMTVECILLTYKYLLQDSFSLRGYFGVLSLTNRSCYVINDSYCMKQVRDSVMQGMASAVAGTYKVAEIHKRQFDIEEIICGSHSEPRYYTPKMLEYAMGRILTYNLSKNVYKPHPEANSYPAYEKQYIEPQVRKYVMEGVYYSIQRHFSFKDLPGRYKEVKKFNDPLMRDMEVNEDLLNEISFNIYKPEMLSAVGDDLKYLQKSLCTAVIISDFNKFGGKINSVSIRICDTVGQLNAGKTVSLLSIIKTNDKVKYSDGYNVAEGVKMRDGSDLPFEIWEYSHSFDQGMADAEPLFGYTAIERFIEQGRQVSWNNILLGQDRKGTSVFANTSDPDSLPMQNKVVHNMVAGSRSGKGVMTMNILAGAVAAGKPIFYIDRKPEMAVSFYEKTKGNMFVINGGMYEAQNDPRGVWSDTGSATKGWDTMYDAMPSYLRDKFFLQRTYVGNFGDYVYWRAIMFCFGIILARGKYKTGPEYARLGGDLGAVFIFDEFRSFYASFESKLMQFSGVPGRSMISGMGERGVDIDKLRDKIQLEQTLLESATNEKEAEKHNKAIIEAQLKLQAKMDSDETKLYAYTQQLFKLLDRDVGYFGQYIQASHRNGNPSEEELLDIFIITQDIEEFALKDLSLPSLKKDGTFDMRGVNAKTSMVRTFANKFANDCFVGNNAVYSNYLGRSADKEIEKLHERSFWAYCTPSSIDVIKTSKPAGTRWFKPYLVLCNNKEEGPNKEDRRKVTVVDKNGNKELVDDPDYVFVRQCRSRIKKTAGGKDLWEDIRLKHLKPGVAEQVRPDNKMYDNLNDGIGFEGLVDLTKQSVGKGSVNMATDLGISADIANYVANQMGFPDYKTLLFDFRPEAMFTMTDVMEAIGNPASFTDYKKRLKVAYDYGLLNHVNSNEDGEEPDTFNPNERDYYDELGINDESNETIGGYEKSVDVPTYEVDEDEGVYVQEDLSFDAEAYGEEDDDSVEFSAKFIRATIQDCVYTVARQKGIKMNTREIDEVVSLVYKSIRGLFE